MSIASATVANAAVWGVPRFPAQPIADTSDAFELRSRWVIQSGPFHRSGRLLLRQLDTNRMSLAIDLPESPLLPRRQFLLREGPAMLAWELPESARPLLEPGSDLWRLLESIPSAAWAALGAGRDIEPFVEDLHVNVKGGRRRAEGGFAGGRVVLEGPRGRPRAMRWRGSIGEYRFRWREGGHRGIVELRILDDAGLNIRLITRIRPSLHLTDEDWLFMEESASFLEPARFSLVEARAIPHELEPR